MNKEIYKVIFDQIKNPLVIADRTGVLDLNNAALELFNRTSKKDLLRDDYFSSLVSEIKGNGSATWDWLNNPDGKPLQLEFSVSPINLEQGLRMLAFRPIDDTAPSDEMSRRIASTIELFNNSPDPIVIVDNTGRITDANVSFETLFGYPRSESVGRDLDDLVVPEKFTDEAKELFRQVLVNGRVAANVQRRSKSGKLLDVYAVAYPLVLDRKITGNYVIYRDISNEKQAERRLREKEQFFEQLFNRSLFPIAILDNAENILDVNLEFERLFGYTKGELLGKCISDYVVAEDYSVESSRFRDTVLGEQAVTARTKRKNRQGQLIDVEVVGSPVVIDGRVVGMFAMYRDIRSEIKALEELTLERAYFRQLFDNSPNPVAIMDRDDRIVNVNSPFETMFDFTLDEVRGQKLNKLIVPERHRPESRDISYRVVDQGLPVQAEVERVSKNGELREVQLIAFPILLGENRLGAYVIYQDIADRKKKEREILGLMNSDSLTGLYNRHYAYQRLDTRLADAQSGGASLSVIYMDLDRFKEINDNLGHQAGDEVLRIFAQRMRSHFESSLELCRIGGDEFLAILGGQAEDREEACGNAIRGLCRDPFVIDGQPVSTCPSLGWARYPDDGSSIDQLISKADARMYADKKLRRMTLNPNRIQVPMEDLLEERKN